MTATPAAGAAPVASDPTPPAAAEVMAGSQLHAGRPPRVPLRITLVALLVTLVTVALVATGSAATSLLRGFLLEQQDQSLRSQVDNVQPRLIHTLRGVGYVLRKPAV